MSRKDKATALGIRSIRYQIMFVLLPIVVAAMVLLSFLGYDTAKQIIQDATNRQMELNLSSAVTIIEKSLAQNRKVAEGLARSVQSNMGVIQPENFRTLLPLMMESNEETFGGGVLFAPYEYDPSQEWFAPYCMKEGDGITYIDNYSLGEGIYYTDQEFFTAAEATDQSAIWTRPYYDSLVNVSMVTASAPIYDAAGVFIGIATADIDLSNLQQVIVNLQGNEGDRVFLLDTDGTYIADEDAEKLLQETITQDSNPSLAALGEEMLTQKSGTGAFEDQGQTYQVWYTQVPESGWIIAFASPEAQLYGSTNRLGNNLMILCAVLTLVVIIVLAIFIQWMLVRPLKRLADVTSGIAEGNLSAEIRNRSKNEIGVVFASVKKTTERLHEYVDYIDEVSGVLNQIAGGNLDYDLRLHYVGEFEKLKFSLENIRDFMTRTMGDVNEASLKVSAGAKQLADGAQALAQGSVEQAATVQELSASITDVAHKTDENAGMAKKAASLAQVIMQNAEKGSRQMNEMTGAVNDINQSSQGISKVMKVIDDIAFQTNILALNAAVEAARAGQHGKGFAVVADEVRNLAAKSAAAAKDTGAMIADSIGKAKLGAQIATETATSLSEIVSGINESSQLIGEISESSQAQNEGIRQINSAIGNVAQIVQQNSATAEQSAAASHEMSNQADILEKLISQFKLRGQNMRHGDIAAGSNKMALTADSHLERD